MARYWRSWKHFMRSTEEYEGRDLDKVLNSSRGKVQFNWCIEYSIIPIMRHDVALNTMVLKVSINLFNTTLPFLPFSCVVVVVVLFILSGTYNSSFIISLIIELCARKELVKPLIFTIPFTSLCWNETYQLISIRVPRAHNPLSQFPKVMTN